MGIGKRIAKKAGRIAMKQVGSTVRETDKSKGGLSGPLMAQADVQKDRQAVGRVTKKARRALLGRGRRSKGSK